MITESSMLLNEKREVIFMAYDYAKLDGLITEKFRTRHNFGKAMKLSERSISLKMSGKREWKQSQIDRACEVLGIQDSEICDYFFKLSVQNH